MRWRHADRSDGRAEQRQLRYPEAAIEQRIEKQISGVDFEYSQPIPIRTNGLLEGASEWARRSAAGGGFAADISRR